MIDNSMILADNIESDLIENVIDKDSELLEELLYEFAKTWDDLKLCPVHIANDNT